MTTLIHQAGLFCITVARKLIGRHTGPMKQKGVIDLKGLSKWLPCLISYTIMGITRLK
jgi:hypothetical protein